MPTNSLINTYGFVRINWGAAWFQSQLSSGSDLRQLFGGAGALQVQGKPFIDLWVVSK